MNTLNKIEKDVLGYNGGNLEECFKDFEFTTNLKTNIPKIKEDLIYYYWLESWGNPLRLKDWLREQNINDIPKELAEPVSFLKTTN